MIGTRIPNHLVHKGTLNHAGKVILASRVLVYEVSRCGFEPVAVT